VGSVIEIFLHEDVGSVAARRHFVAECSHTANSCPGFELVECAVSSVRLCRKRPTCGDLCQNRCKEIG
jgi:hypothetical protein